MRLTVRATQTALLGLLVLLVSGLSVSHASGQATLAGSVTAPGVTEELESRLVDHVEALPLDPVAAVTSLVHERHRSDLASIEAFRPGYGFWQHIFTIPDGSIAFGSATDGSLLAVFPARGDWNGSAYWEDRSLATFVSGRALPGGMTQRREEVARILEPVVGPVIHNATRGLFVQPNARRYGGFLEEWGAIYERFGVPAEIGLAQALIESGFHPTIRSEARALGFCQWLESNWNRMKRLAPNEIEGHNQTTQAAYCAAYLTILAAKYDSFIPALSEHHAGGTNVGRVVITGERLGGQDPREQYFLGSEFSLDLRGISNGRYRELVRTYGPRSYRYAEMVFGNVETVVGIRSSMPQEKIYAMRAPRSISIEEVARVSGLSIDEVRRYNPALIRQVPRTANVYLPRYIEAFGEDVTFWNRPADPAFATVLNEFIGMGATPEEWESPAFESVLQRYRRAFLDTGTEEGAVMATVIAFVVEESYRNSRPAILREFRTSDQIIRLFEQGVRERESFRSPLAAR